LNKGVEDGGFILPFSLFLLLFFSFSITRDLMVFEIEKRFFEETMQAYQLESLFFETLRSFQEEFPEEKAEGRILFDIGYTDYRIKDLGDGKIKADLRIRTSKGAVLAGELLMDSRERKISGWEEIEIDYSD
jgi:hypothetical protein